MAYSTQTSDGLWRKRQLLPYWIIQGLCAGILGVIACLMIGSSTVYLVAGRGDKGVSWFGYPVNDLARVAVAIGTVLLVFCILTIALGATEAVLYKASRLRPALLLAFACIKTTIWLVFFFFVVVSAAHGAPSPLNLILAIMLATTSVGQLVLGAIYTHKLQRSIQDRGRYGNLGLEGGKTAAMTTTDNLATLPRSNTWRKSIPAITITSRQWSPRSSLEEEQEEDITDYESYRNSLLQAENMRTGGNNNSSTHELAAPAGDEQQRAEETRTLASSNYDASSFGVVSPPTSPGMVTTLSPPPLRTSYSPASNTYDFDQADLAITGFYGSGYEGETKGY